MLKLRSGTLAFFARFFFPQEGDTHHAHGWNSEGGFR